MLLVTGSFLSQSQELPKLSTKQSLDNLRFVSRSGEFTYYQRRSGTLLLSKNFDVTEVLKGVQGANYHMQSSADQKKILITQDINYHNYLNLRENKKIYIVDYGKAAPTLIGEGQLAQLHLNDGWVSYFQPRGKKIFFKNLESSALVFEIELKNIKNPYFNPQASMVNEDNILYTDLNELGIPGVLIYDRKSKSVEVFSRGDSPNQKIEICVNEKFLYLLTTGLKDSSLGTQIVRYPKDKLKAPAREQVYLSDKNDIGNLFCDADPNRIFFIKNTAEQKGEVSHEVAEILLNKNFKLNLLTQLKYATQMVNLDGRIIVPFRGNYFVAHGDRDLTIDDKLSPISEEEDKNE
jgi:hypothetical protein